MIPSSFCFFIAREDAVVSTPFDPPLLRLSFSSSIAAKWLEHARAYVRFLGQTTGPLCRSV